MCFLGPGIVRELEGVLANCPRDTVGIIVGNRFSRWAFLRARMSRFDIILTHRRYIIRDLREYRPRRKILWIVLEILKFLILFYICIMVFLIYIKLHHNNNKDHYHVEL